MFCILICLLIKPISSAVDGKQAKHYCEKIRNNELKIRAIGFDKHSLKLVASDEDSGELFVHSLKREHVLVPYGNPRLTTNAHFKLNLFWVPKWSAKPRKGGSSNGQYFFLMREKSNQSLLMVAESQDSGTYLFHSASLTEGIGLKVRHNVSRVPLKCDRPFFMSSPESRVALIYAIDAWNDKKAYATAKHVIRVKNEIESFNLELRPSSSESIAPVTRLPPLASASFYYPPDVRADEFAICINQDGSVLFLHRTESSQNWALTHKSTLAKVILCKCSTAYFDGECPAVVDEGESPEDSERVEESRNPYINKPPFWLVLCLVGGLLALFVLGVYCLMGRIHKAEKVAGQERRKRGVTGLGLGYQNWPRQPRLKLSRTKLNNHANDRRKGSRHHRGKSPSSTNAPESSSEASKQPDDSQSANSTADSSSTGKDGSGSKWQTISTTAGAVKIKKLY